jgi:hypothetical protein
MKHKVRLSALPGISVLVLGIMACGNGVQATGSQSSTSTIVSTAKKSIPVAVTWNGGSSTKTIAKASAARSLNPSVSSVAISVYDASSGASEGTGSLGSLGSGKGFGGKVTVNETGPVVFEATASGSGGSVLDVARANYTVIGSGDSVTLAAGPVSIEGGAIQGQPLSLSTATSLFAGSTAGYSGRVNGTGTGASFYYPTGITTDGTNLFVADTYNNEIRQIVIATGAVTLLAGSPTGATGLANLTGSAATFNQPYGITTDGINLYVADHGNNEIRQIVIATGVVTLLAGDPTGLSGHANGTGTSATFAEPSGVTTDGTNLYVADYGNNEIRQIVIATGAVSLLAGSPTCLAGITNATGTGASFDYPIGIATDGTNLYVADYGSNEIRQVVISSGAVTLLAGDPTGASGHAPGTGTSATFYYPYAITTDGTNLYEADYGSCEIRQIVIATQAVTLLAGSQTGLSGTTNGIGTAARFSYPEGITTDGSNLYVVDEYTHQIRKIQ